MVHRQWLKSYQVEAIVLNAEKEVVSPAPIQLDTLNEPDWLCTKATLSQSQKCRKMLEISQKVAMLVWLECPNSGECTTCFHRCYSTGRREFSASLFPVQVTKLFS